MVARLVTGILAVVFLPLGIVFTIIGLAASDVDSGEPRDFAYTGLPLLALGLVLALAFVLMRRREAGRRRRRREGARTTAEIVRADYKPGIRVGSAAAFDLAVRFSAAGTPDSTARRMILVAPGSRLKPGEPLEIAYDPDDPVNFEPVEHPQ